jgi:hypothetical protein
MYCIVWGGKPTHQITLKSKRSQAPATGGGSVAEKILKKRVKESANEGLILEIAEATGYKLAVKVTPVIGGEFDKKLDNEGKLRLKNTVLSLLNKHAEPDFGIKPIVPKPKQQQPQQQPAEVEISQAEVTEAPTESTELSVVDGDFKELEGLPGGFNLSNDSKMALFKHIKTVVKGADEMTNLQLGTIALDMFTRRIQVQKDVYYWLDRRGELQQCDSVYYLKRWLSKIDKHMGGNGNIEISHRLMTESERVEHGLNDNQIGAVVRERAELMRLYKDVGFEPQAILDLVNSELPKLEKVGVEGYAVVEKTYTVKGVVKETTPPNGWTLYQLAVKRATKNAAKMWSTPNAQEAWALGENRLTDKQFCEVLETNADTILKARDGEELEKFAGYYLPSEGTGMTQTERVELLRGDEEQGID